ncbi:interphotoreceptor matrix proteoglycan 2 [Brachyistius frenatus]|uniref:interphotoreceptor matrix proteoglycan 2 n=1 Tax=Brachyistius frenatus TaxID=100188 RepID=UPI0037E96391
MGYLALPYSEVFPSITRVSEVRASHQGYAVVSRQKREILFPSGIKLCAQDTAEQVAANHLSYFHLRVCQETIWEAFKIFWDRLPEQKEYQSWMSQCQEGSVTALDVGIYFSQSEEHLAVVKKRIFQPGWKSEPPRSWQNLCSTPIPDTSRSFEAPELAKEEEDENAAAMPELEEDSLNNDITMQPHSPAVLEQVVELSILLPGEVYDDDLDDPNSHKYQTLSRQLAKKIEDALEGLPGFKSVTVIEFRPQKEVHGLDAVVVDYAVTVVVVDGAGVSSEQLDYLTLQSNLVENSYREINEPPAVVYTISEVKNFLNEALHNDDQDMVSEITESFNTGDGATVLILDQDRDADVLPEPSETDIKENYVIVLEESEAVAPAVVLTTEAPEDGSIEEEGLLREDTVQTSAAEIPPEEQPIELPTPELPGGVPLPEPPVEVEASGSGTDDIKGPLEPPTTTAVEEETSLEETAAEDVLITEETGNNIVAPSEAGAEEVEVAAVELQPTPTIATDTTEEEEGLPALVPLPEVVDVARKGSEPEAAETGLLPAEGDSVDLADAAIEVMLTHPEEPAPESEGQEVKEETVPEEVPKPTEISTDDFKKVEILRVNEDEPEPTVTLSPPLPTVLPPERESPFTRISDVNLDNLDNEPDLDIPSLEEIQPNNEGLDDANIPDRGYDVIHYGLINHTEEGSTGFPFGVVHGTDRASIAMPVNPGRALMVFFSLRVTNMMFSDDLFNKSSPEYKALEQRFLELLVPYLQSNLSNFENLEILNFRNGSIVVNSRMKFGKPVAHGVTTTVYLILEDFCNTAYQTMNLAIDKYSLDVESGDMADPCKFQACNEYAECKVNKWSGEAECVCNAGYFSVDGLPCQSICELQTDFCLNDGKCDIIPGQGAICRCRVGENWWYRGEHCEEYVSEPLVVGIAIASVAGFLLVASGVIFFLARTLRDQYDKDDSEDPIRRVESVPSLERATKYNPMYESEATTGYSHYYRRYPEGPVYSSASAEASTDYSSEEIRHIYENSELTKEEIQDRIRIIELYAKDRQFADFVRQHQANVVDTRREKSSVHK